jgi:hypothetical protein
MPEKPLIALLGLMHVGVALLVLDLRRRRRMDDRGIHHGSALEQQPLSLKRVIDHVHHLRRQLVTFEQVTEFENRRLVRQRVVSQLQTGKAAHRLDLVQCVLHRRV